MERNRADGLDRFYQRRNRGKISSSLVEIRFSPTRMVGQRDVNSLKSEERGDFEIPRWENSGG